MIDQLEEKGTFLSLRLQMWEDRAVLVALLEWLKDDLWDENRVLKVVDVSPMYSFVPSTELTVFLYTRSLVRHLPSSGQSLGTLQLQPFSVGRSLVPRILLLWPEIVLCRLGQVR